MCLREREVIKSTGECHVCARGFNMLQYTVMSLIAVNHANPPTPARLLPVTDGL